MPHATKAFGSGSASTAKSQLPFIQSPLRPNYVNTTPPHHHTTTTFSPIEISPPSRKEKRKLEIAKQEKPTENTYILLPSSLRRDQNQN